MLGKWCLPYEYMDDRQKFIETSLPDKEGFMEDIADVNYTHGKIVCKDLKKKKIRGISLFICSKQCIIVSRCFRKLSNYVPGNIT